MNDEPGRSGQSAPVAPQGGMALRRDGRRTLLLGTGALVLSLFFFPFALIIGVMAVVAGRRVRRATGGAMIHGAAAGLVLATLGLTFSALQLALVLFVWPEMTGYQECKSSANTVTDEQACKNTWYPKIEDKLHVPSGTLSDYNLLP